VLVVMTGLPGTGKSEIARQIAPSLGSLVLSADPIDSTLARVGIEHDRPDIVGYELMKTVAREHLTLGMSVVIDAVNPFEWVRRQYAEIAAQAETPFVVIATTCSDTSVHRARVERRHERGVKVFTWEGVERQAGMYEPPINPSVVLDAALPLDENVEAVLSTITSLRGEAQT
jgi:predicted kinase